MTGIKADTITATNYWTTRAVIFEDGSSITEDIPGPLSAALGFRTRRTGLAASGDMRVQVIGKARFEAALKEGKFTRA